MLGLEELKTIMKMIDSRNESDYELGFEILVTNIEPWNIETSLIEVREMLEKVAAKVLSIILPYPKFKEKRRVYNIIVNKLKYYPEGKN